MENRPASESPDLKLVSGCAAGVELAVWEWPGADPPLLFAHATSFHGRCWDQIIRMLPERRCLAVDARGHGRSGKLGPPYRWRDFGRDLACVAGHLAVRDAIGIGHSMGGHATVLAASLRPETCRALLLIDPTIFPPETYRTPPFDASFILRRRAEWSSPEEMFERFRDRAPFAAWKLEILHDYCRFGLVANGENLVLACPPEVEASIYTNSTAPESDPYAEVASIAQPVTVLRAGQARKPGSLDLAASPTAPDLAAKFPHGRDVVLPGQSHYIPMELPERVAEEIRRML